MISRREFCQHISKASALLALPLLGLPKIVNATGQEYMPWRELAPHPASSLTNVNILPDSLCSSVVYVNNVNIRMALNFKESFKLNAVDYYNTDHMSGGDLGIYGEGVREAIKRQSPSISRSPRVHLVIDFPGANDRAVNIDIWLTYLKHAISRYRGAYAYTLGNELNVPDNPWNQNPEKFSEYYVRAVDIVRKLSPESKVLMAGEAYYGNHELLRNILRSIAMQTDSLSKYVDGLSCHFYDRPFLMLPWIQSMGSIATDFNLPPAIFLPELGKLEGTEGANLTAEELKTAVVTTLATTIAYHNQGLIDDFFWHTAYAIPSQDPHKHSLSRYDSSGTLHLTPAFRAFWEVSKLLHHSVNIIDTDGVTVVTGLSEQDHKTTILWNNNSKVTTSSKPRVIEGKPVILTEIPTDSLRANTRYGLNQLNHYGILE